jgi:hypothetical protein
VRFAFFVPGGDALRDDRAGGAGHSLGHCVVPLLPDGRAQVQGRDGPQAAHTDVFHAAGRRRECQGPSVPGEDDAAELRGNLVPGQEPRDSRRACPGPRCSTPQEEEECTSCAVRAEDPILQELYDAAEEDAEYQKVKAAWQEDKEPRDLPFGHPARLYNNVWRGWGCHRDRALLTFNGRL